MFRLYFVAPLVLVLLVTACAHKSDQNGTEGSDNARFGTAGLPAQATPNGGSPAEGGCNRYKHFMNRAIEFSESGGYAMCLDPVGERSVFWWVGKSDTQILGMTRMNGSGPAKPTAEALSKSSGASLDTAKALLSGLRPLQ